MNESNISKENINEKINEINNNNNSKNYIEITKN